jgi:DNA-directed RNA polymerase specialized sigma24 family protein
LTRESFEALLAVLHPDREQAGEIYQTIRHRLTRFLEWRGCESPDDLVDETFDRVAQRFADGVEIRNSDPYRFFCGVAHRVFLEVCRKKVRERHALESGEWPPAPAADDPGPDRRLDALRLCLGRLDADDRQVVLAYHAGEDKIRRRQQLCCELGIGINALRIKVHRLRRKLQDCIEARLAN